jgi:Tfp pilus assembly protein PilV
MRERGLALAECMAAVALTGMALMAAAGLLAAQPRAAQRLEARGKMLQHLEATIESVRAGALPLQSAPVAVADPELEVSVTVRAVPPATGLFEVTATARTTVRGEVLSQSLHTMIWRPR